MTGRHHRIDYIEFTVADMARAKRFYGDAFGWTFTDYGPGYCGIVGDAHEQGGFTVGEVVSGGPLIVLYSSDVEASYAQVRAAGGEVTKEIFEFPGGRRFEFKDSEGNALAVWTTL